MVAAVPLTFYGPACLLSIETIILNSLSFPPATALGQKRQKNKTLTTRVNVHWMSLAGSSDTGADIADSRSGNAHRVRNE